MLTPLNSQLHIAVCADDPLDLQRSVDMAREILGAVGQAVFVSVRMPLSQSLPPPLRRTTPSPPATGLSTPWAY